MSTAVAASSFLILLKQNDRLITKEKLVFPCNAQDYEFAFLRLLSRVLTKFSSHGKYKLVF